jgi:acyl-coenzyme A synthetase/AMP-(fatty) acid ligase
MRATLRPARGRIAGQTTTDLSRGAVLRRIYKDALATSLAWDGGWFHTGDLVRIGGDGCFFVDRSKNIVRRSGENIAAVEVESALQTHSDVLAPAVCPVTDEVRGEEVFAFVVLREGIPASLEASMRLQSHCRTLMAYYKVPAYVAFRSELPQTASQKLARAEIKALAARAVESAQAFDLRHRRNARHPPTLDDAFGQNDRCELCD